VVSKPNTPKAHSVKNAFKAIRKAFDLIQVYTSKSVSNFTISAVTPSTDTINTPNIHFSILDPKHQLQPFTAIKYGAGKIYPKAKSI